MDTSTPLDKNSRCASGFCRTSDNKCAVECLKSDDCSSGEVCHSDNKCYSSGLSYEQACAADNGDDVDARCTSGLCRSSDNKCGCDDNDDCSSSELCHSDNKCYSSGLSYEQACAADNGDDVDARCTSGLCRSSDNKCGCDDTDDCSSGEVCHSDNKCYSSGLSIGQDCSSVNGDNVDARCASGFCGSTDNKCGLECLVTDDCSSGQACYSGANGDNKCYPLPSIVSSSTSCNAISGVESDGSAGDLTVAQNGNLILINSNGIITDVSAQFARDGTTTFEDVNNFIIAPGQTVNVLGTLIVKSKRTQIDGEINGTGGGYAGAVASVTARGAWALPGESPPDTNGHGQGGKEFSGNLSGGGGGSHGKLLFLYVFLFICSACLTYLLSG